MQCVPEIHWNRREEHEKHVRTGRHAYDIILLMHSCVQDFNVKAGKIDFTILYINCFSCCWVACEFPPGDQ